MATISIGIRFTDEELKLIDEAIWAHNLTNPPINRTQTIKWAVLEWAKRMKGASK